MKQTMHAAVVEAFDRPLALPDLNIPAPWLRPNSCQDRGMRGLSHRSSCRARRWPVKPAQPFVPGHEGIGRVIALSSGVAAVALGDRVGVPWLSSACGRCEHCLSGWETVCDAAQFGGYTQDGGFAEYIVADPNYVARIPDGLSAVEATRIICAGVTSYKGIKGTGARPGEWLAVSALAGSVIARSSMAKRWA